MYFPQHINTALFAFPVMMPQQAMPAKRSLEPEDAETPTKAKKARGKGKATDANGNGASLGNM